MKDSLLPAFPGVTSEQAFCLLSVFMLSTVLKAKDIKMEKILPCDIMGYKDICYCFYY